MTEQNNVVVEKTTENKKQVNEKLLADLRIKETEFQKELDTKKYLIEGGKESAKKLYQFITEDATWKFTEALGIIEVEKVLIKFIQSADKELMLGPLEIEAIYWFLSKIEGVGFKEASRYYELLKLVNPAKARMDEARKEYETLQFKIASLEHGIDSDTIEEELK